MRAKRWGRAGHGREQPGRRVIFLAVLAGLLVCVVLPVRAQTKTGTLCFPLDTTQYRVSDGYGWRQDPFTGERAFHKGMDSDDRYYVKRNFAFQSEVKGSVDSQNQNQAACQCMCSFTVYAYLF